MQGEWTYTHTHTDTRTYCQKMGTHPTASDARIDTDADFQFSASAPSDSLICLDFNSLH